MEIRIKLSAAEAKALDVEDVEFSDADAVHLLFDATERLNRNATRMDDLRGNVAGQQAELNRVWHENTTLSGLVDGLERVAGLWENSPTK